MKTPTKLNYQQLIQLSKQYWAKIKFELKWRWEDIKHEHSPGIRMDDNPDDPPLRKVPLKVFPKLFYNALVKTGQDLVDDTIYCLELIGLKKKREVPPTENPEQNPQQQEGTTVNNLIREHHDDLERFQIKFQHFVRSRFILIQTSIRQFLIGFNEGMGRDLETFKKKQNISDLLGTSEMIDKSRFMDQVKTVAGGLRKFREEMHGIGHISEDDQLLKEDLQKAKLIQEKDEQVNLFNIKKEEEGSEGKMDTSNLGKDDSSATSTTPVTEKK